MNSLVKNASNFRLKWNHPTSTGHLLLTIGCLLLLLAFIDCRPSTDEYDGFDHEYADVDNVEIHRVKITDGVMQAEGHPVIFYKEDFVSEDYDPDPEKHGDVAEVLRPRKNKDTMRRPRYNKTTREMYRALKPEKIYFDVLPKTPVVIADDSDGIDSHFDSSKIRIEILSLADDKAEVEQEVKDNQNSKQVLSKVPKKYRRRMRRETTEKEHRVQKRNPRYARSYENIFHNLFSSLYSQNNYIRHPVKGIYYNTLSVAGPALRPAGIDVGIRFGSEDETDRVPWVSRQNENKPAATTQRPIPPLFHDSRPENADVSFLTTRRPERKSTTSLQESLRPLAQSPTTSRPITTTTRITQNSQSNPISNCVWAIVECCSRSNQRIRYQCFERNGCFGAFWDLNPCAGRIQDQAINYIDQHWE